MAGITNRVLYGADYNPEQWDRDVWIQDAALMQEAGINMVSVGIFSWALLQPEPDRFEFAWLDDIMDLLANHGISVDLATATASPPAWLIAQHPDILPVDQYGSRYVHGSRQHYCPNSQHYRGAAAQLVRRLAERYQNHPALRMWHVNNEYGCHIAACYCDTCQTAFRVWLKDRYQTLDVLNDRWGTAFWSQAYGQWDEIGLPGHTPTFRNPGQELDYARFMSDSLYACYEQEAVILRSMTPNVPLTTNFMGLFKPLDYFRWAPGLDVVSWDSYPDPAEALPITAALGHDLMRGLKSGQPFILMEQTPSAVNWRPVNLIKAPGVMRLWSYEALAHGGDGVLFFQWRASRAGSEKFHGAMVGHSGRRTDRVFQEVAHLGQELAQLEGIVGSRVPARVAIAFDWENWWALELPSKPRDMNYIERVVPYYRALFTRNIAVDIIHPSMALDNYDVLILPGLYLFQDSYQSALESFVARGGTLMTDFFSGIVDANDRVRLGGYPAPLKDILGLEVEEFYPLANAGTVDVISHSAVLKREQYQARFWAEHIHLTSAEPWAAFHGTFFSGAPAVAVNQWGKGRSVYFAALVDASLLGEVIDNVLAHHQITPPLAVPNGVEARVRETDDTRFHFVLNHRDDPVTIALPATPLINLLTGEPADNSAFIPGKDILVLAEPKGR